MGSDKMYFTNALCVLFLTHPLLMWGEHMKPGAWILSIINYLLPLSVPTSLMAVCLLGAWCVLFYINFEKLLVKRRCTAWENIFSLKSWQWTVLAAPGKSCVPAIHADGGSQGIANKMFLVLKYSAGQQKVNEM